MQLLLSCRYYRNTYYIENDSREVGNDSRMSRRMRREIPTKQEDAGEKWVTAQECQGV